MDFGEQNEYTWERAAGWPEGTMQGRQRDSASVWFIRTQVFQHRFPMSPLRVNDAQIEDGAKDHLNRAGRRTPRRGHHTGRKNEEHGHVATKGREDAGRLLFANEYTE